LGGWKKRTKGNSNGKSPHHGERTITRLEQERGVRRTVTFHGGGGRNVARRKVGLKKKKKARDKRQATFCARPSPVDWKEGAVRKRKKAKAEQKRARAAGKRVP